MSKNTTKKGTGLTWLIVIIVTVAIYFVAFWYVKLDLEKSSYTLNSAEVAYNQKDRVKSTSEAIKQLENEITKIDSYFVRADDVVSFINLLEQKGEERGVSVETTNVSIENDTGELLYGEILSLSILVVGDWNEVMQYLSLIENMPYNIWITSTNLSLERDTDAEEPNIYNWEADVTLQVLKHN